MSLFSLENSKASGLTDQCREIIKKEKENGMFDPCTLTIGKQEYTTIYLLMTQDCNLSCSYCYQPKEFRQKHRVMPNKIMDDTVRFGVKNFDDSKLRFSLFGGEPFLNFEGIKYIVDKYPMFRYVVTTNGKTLCEEKSVRDWVMKRKDRLTVSVSIGSLKQAYGDEYLKKAEGCFEVLNANGGDIHYVADETSDKIFDEIMYLYSRVRVVRVSSVRHSDKVKADVDGYKRLFNRVSDFLYFGDKPMFGRSQWDVAFHNNIYCSLAGKSVTKVPPTFCGCGYLYLAISDNGDIYPCDFFANYPEFKIGDIYNGLNDTSLFFKRMGEWIEDLYVDCENCTHCPDIRLCPRAMCLAENYTVSGNPLKPAKNHCICNEIEYQNYDYIARKAIKLGVDKLYEKARV